MDQDQVETRIQVRTWPSKEVGIALRKPSVEV